jgi:hypothetical protein
MHRYFLFVFEDYYPSGGWNDFVCDYASIEEAFDAYLSEHKNNGSDSYQIVDSQTGKVVG